MDDPRHRSPSDHSSINPHSPDDSPLTDHSKAMAEAQEFWKHNLLRGSPDSFSSIDTQQDPTLQDQVEKELIMFGKRRDTKKTPPLMKTAKEDQARKHRVASSVHLEEAIKPVPSPNKPKTSPGLDQVVQPKHDLSREEYRLFLLSRKEKEAAWQQELQKKKDLTRSENRTFLTFDFSCCPSSDEEETPKENVKPKNQKSNNQIVKKNSPLKKKAPPTNKQTLPTDHGVAPPPNQEANLFDKGKAFHCLVSTVHTNPSSTHRGLTYNAPKKDSPTVEETMKAAAEKGLADIPKATKTAKPTGKRFPPGGRKKYDGTVAIVKSELERRHKGDDSKWYNRVDFERCKSFLGGFFASVDAAAKHEKDNDGIKKCAKPVAKKKSAN